MKFGDNERMALLIRHFWAIVYWNVYRPDLSFSDVITHSEYLKQFAVYKLYNRWTQNYEQLNPLPIFAMRNEAI